MMKNLLLTSALLPLLAFGHAIAGEMSDFESALRNAYIDYKTALFDTNTGKAAEASAAIDKFTAQWSELSAKHVPPQYADDSGYNDTIRKVADLAARAKDAIAAGRLPEAHEILEGIREQIGDMHIRAGLFSLSDRMNAYHARMEKVIGNSAMDAGTAREEAAVLTYLIDDIIAHPPAAAGPDFAKLTGEVKASVTALKAAAETGEADKIKAAIGKLKKPYTQLFLQFG